MKTELKDMIVWILIGTVFLFLIGIACEIGNKNSAVFEACKITLP